MVPQLETPSLQLLGAHITGEEGARTGGMFPKHQGAAQQARAGKSAYKAVAIPWTRLSGDALREVLRCFCLQKRPQFEAISKRVLSLWWHSHRLWGHTWAPLGWNQFLWDGLGAATHAGLNGAGHRNGGSSEETSTYSYCLSVDSYTILCQLRQFER